jgi:hypothetical protein
LILSVISGISFSSYPSSYLRKERPERSISKVPCNGNLKNSFQGKLPSFFLMLDFENEVQMSPHCPFFLLGTSVLNRPNQNNRGTRNERKRKAGRGRIDKTPNLNEEKAKKLAKKKMRQKCTCSLYFGEREGAIIVTSKSIFRANYNHENILSRCQIVIG